MGNIAIIPARGGSKRIPKKNIKLFYGKPLIAYSIESAKKSQLFEKIVVSTDDDAIANIALKYGATIIQRPKELADDFTPTQDVIQHALEVIDEPFDYLCTIYATAPFLDPKYLQKGYEKLQKSDAVIAFSATSMPFPIQRTFAIKNGRCEMFFPEHFFSRSQDLEEAYQDAGQFYWRNLKKEAPKITFSSQSIPIVLPRYLVQDIDTQEDWKMAEVMFEVLQRRIYIK